MKLLPLTFVLLLLSVTSCSSGPAEKPSNFQIAVGSTTCRNGAVFKAIEGWPYWKKVGTCYRKGSVAN